jgi:hypothetical protein
VLASVFAGDGEPLTGRVCAQSTGILEQAVAHHSDPLPDPLLLRFSRGLEFVRVIQVVPTTGTLAASGLVGDEVLRWMASGRARA